MKKRLKMLYASLLVATALVVSSGGDISPYGICWKMSPELGAPIYCDL